MAARRRHVRIWPPLFFGLLLNYFVLVYTKKVVLLDTKDVSAGDKFKDWQTYTENEGVSGWEDASYTWKNENQPSTVYTACDIKATGVNNWLRVPYIDRLNANSLYIEFTFMMRRCSKIGNGSNLQQCKETFNLYFFEAASDFANQQRPSWDELSYTKVDKIAADEVFEDNKESNKKMNIETRQILLSPSLRRGVYFAIQDEGACVTIMRIRVYYIKCPRVVKNFAYFDEIPTGDPKADKLQSLVDQVGVCVDHATKKNEVTYLCQTDGTWFQEPKGGQCVCMPGYEGNSGGTQCIACSADEYKWSEGRGPCNRCPAHSKSSEGAHECTCDVNYFRGSQDPKSMPCTQPPSAPRSPVIESLTFTSVTLRWDPPASLGGRTDVHYRIVCHKCGDKVLFRPGWNGFNTTSVMLSGLAPGVSYEVIIFSENGVSDASGVSSHSVSVNVVTTSVGKVINLKRVSMGPNHITISWEIPPSMNNVNQFEVRYYQKDKPSSYMDGRTSLQNFTIKHFMPKTDYVFVVRAEINYGWGEYSDPLTINTGSNGDGSNDNLNSDGDYTVDVKRVSVGTKHITIAWEVNYTIKTLVTGYEVKYYPASQPQNEIVKATVLQNLTLNEFLKDTEYHFQVRCKFQRGWSSYSKPLVVHTGQKDSDDTATAAPIGIIAGSIVAVILCMAIATIMIIILLRRNHPNCSEKKDCDAYSHGHPVDNARDYKFQKEIEVTMPLFPSPGSIHSSVRTYVDPHTYEDPNQAVREFTREIDACHITIESVIGGGEFGDVCKGKLRVPTRMEMTVAIKTLKPGATEKNRLDFLTEASIMGQFDDPNVIFLEGVVTKTNPIMIVTEYMANGSLDTFLRNNDGKFTIIQLVGMMRGVASGMKYLSEMGFVHRDLAARNILVNEMLVCKVADFGLSREIESDTTEGAYTTTGGKIPVRWTAPEAIAFRKFTSASDVWSYGVVMWEIVSYGERPYYNWSNQDVIKAVEKGYRLPPPMDCPEAIHQLMLDCWQKERSHRPKLGQIVKTIEKLIRAPELLRKQAKPRPHNFIDPSMPDMTTLSNVDDWLVSIKMERYLTLFLSAGVNSMEQVRHLTVRDLLNMGINLVGHQKKIMNSIQTFRAQTGAIVVGEVVCGAGGFGETNTVTTTINGQHPHGMSQAALV